MKTFLENLDIQVSKWVLKNFQSSPFRKITVLLNRGEVFAVILLGFSFLDQVVYPVIGLLYTGIVAYLNDRLILLIKKKVSRRRPSLRLLDKPNNHPDLNHSFPSAHAANSMLVATILCNEFGFHFLLYFLSFLAGIGRLLTLHHFLSDILGGWIIGLIMGGIGLWVLQCIRELGNFLI